jgi:hypothetical protein
MSNIDLHLDISGSKIYHKVYAIDAVGLVSDTVVSDGVIVDKTGPVSELLIHLMTNIVSNPSFEITQGSIISVLHADTRRNSRQKPDYWLMQLPLNMCHFQQSSLLDDGTFDCTYKCLSDHGVDTREKTSWHRHTFYFTATTNAAVLTIGSMDLKTGLFFDNVQVLEVQLDSNSTSSGHVIGHIEVCLCQEVFSLVSTP